MKFPRFFLFLFIFLVLTISLVPTTLAKKPSEQYIPDPNITLINEDDFQAGDFLISAYQDGKKLKKEDIDWFELLNQGSSTVYGYEYIDGLKYDKDGLLKDPLSNITFRVEPSFIQNKECDYSNSFLTQCVWDETTFDSFKAKNIITNESIAPVYYSDWDAFWEVFFSTNWGTFVEFQNFMRTPYAYDITFTGSIDDLDPEINQVFSTSSNVIWTNNTDVTSFGVSNIYNGTAQSGYNATDGDFRSLVFYNSTSTYWNITFNIADTASTRTGVVDNYGINLSHDNLVGYWDLDLANTNGTFMLDRIGRNNGTIVGNPTNATGLSSGAMDFDGTGDYINTGNLFTDFGRNDFSVSLWIKPDDGQPAANDELFGIRGAGSNRIQPFIRTTGTLEIDYLSNGALSSYASDSAVFSNGVQDWTHVVYVATETADIELYVNGVSVPFSVDAGVALSANNMDVYTPTTNFAIGISSGTTNYFAGSIDEFMMWNDSLSSAQVQDIYKAGLSQHADTNITLETRTATEYNLTDPDLLLFMPFKNSSTNIFDESGNGNNGTIGGNTNWGEENGTVGGGYRFDGTGDNIETDTTYVQADQDFTISAWVRPNGVQATYARIAEFGLYSDGWFLGTSSPAGSYEFIVDSSSVAQNKGGTVTSGSWQHVVGTWTDATTIAEIWVDGVSVDSTNFGAAAAKTKTLTIGSRGGASGTSNWKGEMDEIRHYNRKLSDAEILDLYNLGTTHIAWNDWKKEGVCQDGIADAVTDTGLFMQYRANFNSNSTATSPYIFNQSVSSNNVTIWEAPDTTNPNCTLISITPSDIEENSTGLFQMIINCTDSGGINISSMLHTKTLDHDDSGIPNEWSIRPPDNNKGFANGQYPGEHIYLADGRADNKWYDNYLVNGNQLFADNYTYSVQDESSYHVEITNGSTWATLNFTWSVEPSVFEQMVFLSRGFLEKEPKLISQGALSDKEYNVRKDNGLLVKFWVPDPAEDNYTITSFVNINYTGDPKEDLDLYFCNSSYDVVGGTSPINDNSNCVFIDSITPEIIDTPRGYISRNSSYLKSTFGIISGQIGGVVAAEPNYIYYSSRAKETTKSYYISYANGTSGTNVSFKDSKVAWSTTDNGVTFTQAEFTPDIWISQAHEGQEIFAGIYVEDTSGNNYTNFSMIHDDIGLVNHPIGNPGISYYNNGTCVNGFCDNKDEDLNGTYANDMTIHVNIALDPDATGNVTHNLTLMNIDGTLNYIINTSFVSPTGADLNIFFDTTLVADGHYRMQVNATAGIDPDLDRTDTTSFIQENNFTIDNTGPNITITFPVDGSTQNVNVTSMNYTFTDLYSEVSSCWYYNGTGNTTIACGTNVTGLTTGEGSFTWGVCSNDTLGNEDCSYTTFTVDVVPPTVTIIVPATNQEFTDATDIPLNFTIVEGSLSACTYSLNGAANITLPGCISGSNLFSFNDSIEGMNEIYVYANDSGNGLGLDSVMFDINTQNNTLLIFPTEDEWEVTDSITLQGMCRFTNGTVCGSDIACRFSAYYPNNTIFLESVFGTWNAGGRYTYAIGFTNTSTTNIAGPYTSAMSCYDGFDQDAAFTWHVLSEDNQYVFLYSLLLITAILLIIFGEWKNQWPLKYMGGLLFSFVGLWLFIHGIPGQTLSYLSSGNEDAWISWVSWIIMGFGFLYFFKAVYEDALGGDQ